MAHHTVTLGVSPADSRGIRHLTCDPAVLHAKPGDTIGFTAGTFPFAVVAKGSSPIDRVYIQNDGKTNEPHVKVQGPAGVYSLACAVVVEGKIYMDANCPSIPVDPGLN